MKNDTSPRTPQKRSRFLLDVPLQFSVIGAILAVLLVMSVLYTVAALAFSADAYDSSELTSQRATQLGMLVNGIYFLCVLTAVLVVGIRVTHRIAGPAIVIERAVRALAAGNLDQRLELRDRDHLKSLASAVGDLGRDLREEAEARSLFNEQLTAALDSGDYEQARLLCRQAEQKGQTKVVSIKAA